MTIVRTFKSKRTANRMAYVSHRKATRRTTGIANRVIYKYVLVIKPNSFNNSYIKRIKLNCSLSASTPELVLDKPLPLSFLLGIIRTIDTSEIERTNFRSKG